MSRRTKYLPYSGGLDTASSPKAIKPGLLTQCLNFEEVFGYQGYRSIQGYERFDGRDKPSDQTYSIVTFDLGTAAIAVGETVTNATTATGEVVSVSLTSGSWAGGDAAGFLIITLADDSWADNDPIRVGGVQRATANGESSPGAANDTDYEVNLLAAKDYVRAKIQKVPGEGSVLGVAVYRANVYAVRNAAGSTTATLWKSSAGGWTSLYTGLIPSGAWKFKVANFSGASTTLALFGVDGKNRQIKYDGVSVTKASPIWGSEATSASNLTVGTGAKVFVVAEAGRGYQIGDPITAWKNGDASISMTGTVTNYVGNTVTTNITSTTGAGTHNTWELGKPDFTDKAFDLTAHKDHMFWAYPLGQLQTSNLGDPMLATTTASLFGLGAEVTGLMSFKGAVLGVFCREKIHILNGNNSTDWDMALYTEGAGAVEGTVGDNVGNSLFLDDKGVLSLQATQAFGDFEPAVLSRSIREYLKTKMGLVVGARMVKNSNQYRLYFSDGQMARFTILNGNPVLSPKDISATRQEYIHVPTCFAAGTMSDNNEGLFFGTEDGYVMQEDKGTSFDGEAIQYIMRTAFCHYDSPANKKRMHRLEFELDSPDSLSLHFRQLFDYDDGVYGVGATQDAAAQGTGGVFDLSMLDVVQFDLPIYSKAEVNVSGVGCNMALLLFVESAFVRPFTLQGLNTDFTILAEKR